jgi:hypothetical protein
VEVDPHQQVLEQIQFFQQQLLMVVEGVVFLML